MQARGILDVRKVEASAGAQIGMYVRKCEGMLLGVDVISGGGIPKQQTMDRRHCNAGDPVEGSLPGWAA